MRRFCNPASIFIILVSQMGKFYSVLQIVQGKLMDEGNHLQHFYIMSEYLSKSRKYIRVVLILIRVNASDQHFHLQKLSQMIHKKILSIFELDRIISIEAQTVAGIPVF